MNQQTARTTLFDENQKKKTGVDPVVKVINKEKQEEKVPATRVSKVLYKAKGVWPFDLIPDEVIVEEDRVIVKTKYFPIGSDIGTLPMNKVSSVEVTHSIFFSALDIQCTELHGYSAKIKWLKHEDAQHVKEIIDGIKIKEASQVVLPENVNSEQLSHTYQTMGQL